MANQLLSVIAFCLATTLLIKMEKTRYLAITILPLLFMCAVTFTAGYLKIFSPDPKLGFLSGASAWLTRAAAANGGQKAAMVRQAMIWRLDAVVAGVFLLLVLLIVLGSAQSWWRLLRSRNPSPLHESEFVPVASLNATEAAG